MGNVGETRVVESSLESLQALRWAAVVQRQRLPVPSVQHELENIRESFILVILEGSMDRQF